MKKLSSAASFGLVLAMSAAAFADAPAPEKATAPRPIVPPPPFAALPSGTMTTPPKDKAPTRIPKTEKVEGFFVADPPKSHLEADGKITNVQIFAKEDTAKDYTAGKFFSSSATDETVCFTQPDRFRFRGFGGEDAPKPEWGSDIEPTARIHAQMKQPPPRKKGEKVVPFKPGYGEMEVTALHQERFIQEDKKARVEIIDAWVDPVTHGVRLIGKSTIPLERIGSAWHGVKLYAARGQSVIHVVARRDKPKELNPGKAPTRTSEFRLMSALRQPLMIQTPSGDHDQTQCGFAHVALKAQQGSAETAMFETNTVFIDPPEPKHEKEKGEGEEESLGFGRHEDEGPPIRLRPFRATVSSTWTSKDTAPVISVSFGWAGREREM
jgi:hypothetical protein